MVAAAATMDVATNTPDVVDMVTAAAMDAAQVAGITVAVDLTVADTAIGN